MTPIRQAGEKIARAAGALARSREMRAQRSRRSKEPPMQPETSSRDRARPGRISSLVALSLVASLLTAAALLPILSGFTGQAEGAGAPGTSHRGQGQSQTQA